MSHPIHQYAIEVAERAIKMMDDLMRDKIDLDIYARRLNTLDVDSVLEQFDRNFKQDPKLVYCLEILMIISSLQHELGFQVAEYGTNVASEDIRMLEDLVEKLCTTEI